MPSRLPHEYIIVGIDNESCPDKLCAVMNVSIYDEQPTLEQFMAVLDDYRRWTNAYVINVTTRKICMNYERDEINVVEYDFTNYLDAEPVHQFTATSLSGKPYKVCVYENN